MNKIADLLPAVVFSIKFTGEYRQIRSVSKKKKKKPQSDLFYVSQILAISVFKP